MKEDINALDEIHKGACMGKDALSFVMDKVEDDSLKKELEKEYKDYDSEDDMVLSKCSIKANKKNIYKIK